MQRLFLKRLMLDIKKRRYPRRYNKEIIPMKIQKIREIK